MILIYLYKYIFIYTVFNTLDILKIDNLWAFENLTKLQLDNNIIEKIENISFLKNLQWLGKSFYLISYNFLFYKKHYKKKNNDKNHRLVI